MQTMGKRDGCVRKPKSHHTKSTSKENVRKNPRGMHGSFQVVDEKVD